MTLRTLPETSPIDQRDRVLLGSAAVVTVVLWASAFVGIRAAAEDFDPGALTLGRIVVGTAALAIMQLRMRRRLKPAGSTQQTRRIRDAPRWVLIGVIVWGISWFGVYNLALNAAERHIDAGTAALLVNIAPMITAVLAGILLGEGFPRRLIVGMLVSLLGVVVVAVATSTGRFDPIGVALAVLAAVIYGTAATAQKRLLHHLNASTLTLIGCLAGTLACLPFLPNLLRALEAAPLPSILAVVYLGVFPTAVAFTTWGYVLSRSSAGRTAATTYAIPAVVILLSWLVLNETPPTLAIIGGAVALAGVAIATLRRRTPR
ncbi:DMT family transporter [Cryobacterium sp. SO1]|uniref:DMT family transporter n=1 Tax=Cryobacterium sp. SO1 TaxID=1897061 RepID=UPI001022F664|nr:DMT family transporter [Cryobacterium sp. SO1]RZI36323.1 putative cystine transporter YijE [Cryobacterium sp. SO1]